MKVEGWEKQATTHAKIFKVDFSSPFDTLVLMKGNLQSRSMLPALRIAFAVLLIPFALCAQRVPIEVPPEPTPKPTIPSLAEIDADGNRIDDMIDTAVLNALDILEDARATLTQRIRARASLRQVIDVEFVFSRQITLRELKQFIAAGGKVVYIMHSSYGWTGRISRANVYDLHFVTATGFVGVVGPRTVVLH